MDHETTDTRLKLLEAAGEVFSEKGFRQASVREISRRAGLGGPALINYHFRDKKGLYRETLAYSFELARKLAYTGAVPASSAEERLYAYVHMQLTRTKAVGRPSWFDKLMAREMFEPTEVFEEVVRASVLPVSANLLSIVQELLGRPDRSREVIYSCLSVVGQCLHHHFARRVIAVLYPELSYTPEDLKVLAQHITRFSLAGIRAVREAMTTQAGRTEEQSHG